MKKKYVYAKVSKTANILHTIAGPNQENVEDKFAIHCNLVQEKWLGKWVHLTLINKVVTKIVPVSVKEVAEALNADKKILNSY